MKDDDHNFDFSRGVREPKKPPPTPMPKWTDLAELSMICDGGAKELQAQDQAAPHKRTMAERFLQAIGGGYGRVTIGVTANHPVGTMKGVPVTGDSAVDAVRSMGLPHGWMHPMEYKMVEGDERVLLSWGAQDCGT